MNQNDPFKLFYFNHFSEFNELIHFVSSRAGGVSLPPYHSLNLGLHTADNTEHVIRNRELIAQEIGLPLSHIAFAQQVHSANVTVVDHNLIKNGLHIPIASTDALITNISGICLITLVADCVPILLFDPEKQAVAAIHSGWRGTLQEIVSAAVQQMQLNFACNPSNIIAGIGPSAGACCYEVGEDVKVQFEQLLPYSSSCFTAKINGKYFIDLWEINRKQLVNSGVQDNNIEISNICTICHSDTYFSSRAHNGLTGRFAAGICLKPL